jgi:hypothetical protein
VSMHALVQRSLYRGARLPLKNMSSENAYCRYACETLSILLVITSYFRSRIYLVLTTSSIFSIIRTHSVARDKAEEVTSSGWMTFYSFMSLMHPFITLMPAYGLFSA